MRNSHVDKRSARYAARQFVSDVEYEPLEGFVSNETNGNVAVSAASNKTSGRAQGTVKFFNGDKGFGFVRRDNAPDVFIHANELKRSGIEGGVKTGDVLEFEVLAVDGKGPKAANIKMIAVAK